MATDVGSVTETAPHAPPREAIATTGFDWVATLLASWLVGGIFLDGWAHAHIPSLESIVTPWHAVLYSGYAVNAAFLVVALALRHERGQNWRAALPAGYLISLLGAAIFLVGGVFDLTGHVLFGIEKDIEGLLSPTHLILALGAALIVTGPLRAAVARRAVAPSLFNLLPAVLSLTYVLALLMFFTQYAQPIVHSYADKVTTDSLRGLGIYAVLVQTASFMGVTLYAVRYWRLPFGAFAVIIGLSDALINTQAQPVIAFQVLLVGVVTGLLVDTAYLALRRLPPHTSLAVFAFIAPAIIYAVYFLVLASLHGIAWSGYLVGGSVAQAGLVGLLMSLLVLSPVRQMPA